jgi:hypothetical protein
MILLFRDFLPFSFRFRIYVPGLWHLKVIPSFSGYCMRNVIVFLVLIACLGIILVTISDTQAIWKQQKELDDKHVAMATSDYSAAVATDTKNPSLNYGVVIDCGSSGSRVFVYFWPTHEGQPNELLHILPFRDEAAKPVVKKIEPGSLMQETHWDIAKIISCTCRYINICR